MCTRAYKAFGWPGRRISTMVTAQLPRRFIAMARQDRYLRLLFAQVDEARTEVGRRAFFAGATAPLTVPEEPFTCPPDTPTDTNSPAGAKPISASDCSAAQLDIVMRVTAMLLPTEEWDIGAVALSLAAVASILVLLLLLSRQRRGLGTASANSRVATATVLLPVPPRATRRRTAAIFAAGALPAL